MILGRGRFKDVIRRQLDLFGQDEDGLIADCDEKEAAYSRAPRDEFRAKFGRTPPLLEEAIHSGPKR